MIIKVAFGGGRTIKVNTVIITQIKYKSGICRIQNRIYSAGPQMQLDS